MQLHPCIDLGGSYETRLLFSARFPSFQSSAGVGSCLFQVGRGAALHLTANMSVLSVLPSDFGYVIFIYLYSWVMLVYLSVKVGAARKKYDVKVM